MRPPADQMTPLTTAPAVIEALARDPLRHIVLLRQLVAYPAHVKVHRVSGAAGTATLVALDTSVSSYDRHAYPKAGIAAFTTIAALELARYGVTVNAVAPVALTRMTEGLGPAPETDAEREMRSPRWIAPIATWLA